MWRVGLSYRQWRLVLLAQNMNSLRVLQTTFSRVLGSSALRTGSPYNSSIHEKIWRVPNSWPETEYSCFTLPGFIYTVSIQYSMYFLLYINKSIILWKHHVNLFITWKNLPRETVPYTLNGVHVLKSLQFYI